MAGSGIRGSFLSAPPAKGRVVVPSTYEHDVKVWDLANAPIEPTDWEAHSRVVWAAIVDDGGLAVVNSEYESQVWADCSASGLDDRFVMAGPWHPRAP
jgi:hypothetical protein